MRLEHLCSPAVSSRDREVGEVRRLAESLVAALDQPAAQTAFAAVEPIGGSSHQVDEIIRPHAERVGFSSQRRDLFRDYPVRLRPDWFRSLDPGGVLLETERGKTLTNNMDLLDLWKCHICREAEHLILIVPITVTRTRTIEVVYDRVLTRLATFFQPGNEVNVTSVTVVGYP